MHRRLMTREGRGKGGEGARRALVPIDNLNLCLSEKKLGVRHRSRQQRKATVTVKMPSELEEVSKDRTRPWLVSILTYLV